MPLFGGMDELGFISSRLLHLNVDILMPKSQCSKCLQKDIYFIVIL